MKRKPDSTYPVNRRQPYRRQVMLPEPVPKCAYCRIRKGNRFGVAVREYDLPWRVEEPEPVAAGLLRGVRLDGSHPPYILICDRCITEAARGAKMDPDEDEDRWPTAKMVKA